MLDLCLALGIPSPRHLEHALTPGELRAWFAKLARDQFTQHGQDVRDAIRQSRLFTALRGLGGSRGTVHPRKCLIDFSPRRVKPMDDARMERMAEAWCRASGGKVVKHGEA